MVQGQRSDTLVDVTIRPLQESELPAADKIFRLAFGTFLGLPEPETFWSDTDFLRPRWKADPTRVFAAGLSGTYASHYG